MAMSCRGLLAGSAALLAMAGCDTVHENGSTDPGFGEAVRYDAAIQTINPDPVAPPGAAQPGDNGAVGAAAAKRYRTDTVKPVETITTTNAGSSGSGGGGGAGSSGGKP